MTALNKETIDNLTRLCRIDCSSEERAALLIDLQKILGYFDLLNQIDTENIPPCNHVLQEITCIMREDIPLNSLPREDFLANAPSHIGGMVKVRPVIKQG